MKKTNTFLTMFLAMLTFGFVLVGCGDDADADDGDDVDTEEVAENADAVEDGDMRGALLDMSKEMHDIVEGIETVEDVEAAEGDISAIFDKLTSRVKGAIASGATMEEMGQMMEGGDAEIEEWGSKIEAMSDELKASNPEAAAKLESVMMQQSMKLASVFMEQIPDEAKEALKEGMEEAAEETADEAE